MAGVIRTNAAASMLGVSPNTLRSWERRFGFPAPRRTAGGHRQYDLVEIESLRAALEDSHNISSAISIVLERGSGPASDSRLTSAFGRYDEDGCDRLLEESLAVRSLERTLAEVLLPAVQGCEREPGCPEHEFAWRYATRWMSAAMRAAPPASRPEGVLVFDGTTPGRADALHAQALELVLRRAGLRTLTLGSGLEQGRMTSALSALRPHVVVLAGAGAGVDSIARLVYAARRVGGDALTIFDFHGALGGATASTVATLDPALGEAREQVLAALERPALARGERFARAAAVPAS